MARKAKKKELDACAQQAGTAYIKPIAAMDEVCASPTMM
jgi:hypothetical protein